MKDGNKVEQEIKNEPQPEQKNPNEVKEEYNEVDNDYRITSENRISRFVVIQRIRILSRMKMTSTSTKTRLRTTTWGLWHSSRFVLRCR